MLEFTSSDSRDSEEANLLVARRKYHNPESYKEAIATTEKAKSIAACYEELMAFKKQ